MKTLILLLALSQQKGGLQAQPNTLFVTPKYPLPARIADREHEFHTGPYGNIPISEPSWWPPPWWREIAYFPGATLPRFVNPFSEKARLSH